MIEIKSKICILRFYLLQLRVLRGICFFGCSPFSHNNSFVDAHPISFRLIMHNSPIRCCYFLVRSSCLPFRISPEYTMGTYMTNNSFFFFFCSIYLQPSNFCIYNLIRSVQRFNSNYCPRCAVLRLVLYVLFAVQIARGK